MPYDSSQLRKHNREQVGAEEKKTTKLKTTKISAKFNANRIVYSN